MDVRNETRQEVLIDVLDQPIASFDELVERCHRALSAHLSSNCQTAETIAAHPSCVRIENNAVL
jgi:hypothetical protein